MTLFSGDDKQNTKIGENIKKFQYTPILIFLTCLKQRMVTMEHVIMIAIAAMNTECNTFSILIIIHDYIFI